MMVLISYDVSTTTPEGRKRLRKVAETCLDYGCRVQNSVFECNIDPALWTVLRQRLLDIIDPEHDSLRFYFLGRNWRKHVEHVGTRPSMDVENDTLIV